MNFECWVDGAWAAGSWVEGSWCPGATPVPPSSEGTGMVRRMFIQHDNFIQWKEDEEIVIL